MVVLLRLQMKISLVSLSSISAVWEHLEDGRIESRTHKAND